MLCRILELGQALVMHREEVPVLTQVMGVKEDLVQVLQALEEFLAILGVQVALAGDIVVMVGLAVAGLTLEMLQLRGTG